MTARRLIDLRARTATEATSAPAQAIRAPTQAPVQGQSDPPPPPPRRQIGMFAALEAQHALGTTCFRAHAPKERARTVPFLSGAGVLPRKRTSANSDSHQNNRKLVLEYFGESPGKSELYFPGRGMKIGFAVPTLTFAVQAGQNPSFRPLGPARVAFPTLLSHGEVIESVGRWWCISPVFTLCIDLFHARVLGQGFTPTRQKPAMMLIPGQVHSVAVASGAATTTKKRRTRKRRKGKGRPAAGAEGKAERIRYGRPGGRPNVFWLHVSEADLRSHPRYVPLAPPRCLGLLTDWAAVSQFRQDSRQWSLLHNGRLTTSRAAGALGILEPHAASVLNVPRGLRGSHKAQHTLAHLRQQTAFEILNLEDATACLCVYAVDEGRGTNGAGNGRRRKTQKQRRLGGNLGEATPRGEHMCGLIRTKCGSVENEIIVQIVTTLPRTTDLCR